MFLLARYPPQWRGRRPPLAVMRSRHGRDMNQRCGGVPSRRLSWLVRRIPPPLRSLLVSLPRMRMPGQGHLQEGGFASPRTGP